MSGLCWAAASIAAAAMVSTAPSDRIVRTLPVRPGTPVSIEVTIGDVVVRGWDRSEVAVEIDRRALDGRPLVASDVGEAADGVVVRAVQEHGGRDARMRTDVLVRVPAATPLPLVEVFEGRVELDGLRGPCGVKVERGPIVGRQLAGPIRLETVIGDIRVERLTLSPATPVRIRTFNGDVALELAAAPADARILALSMGGTITSDIPLALKQGWGPRFGEATLGRGEPLVALDAVNGDIIVRVRK